MAATTGLDVSGNQQHLGATLRHVYRHYTVRVLPKIKSEEVLKQVALDSIPLSKGHTLRNLTVYPSLIACKVSKIG